MIYIIDPRNQIEQGDICKDLPKITSDQFFTRNADYSNAWEFYTSAIIAKDRPITFLAKPIPTNGVILSQTCDIVEGMAILFAELEPRELSHKTKGRINEIKRILRDETRFHFFPPDISIPTLNKPHIINFKSLFLVPYDILKNNLQQFFVARLISEAQKVLCDKISRFFTRLAFEDLMFHSHEEIEYIVQNDDEIQKDDVNRILKALGRPLL